MEINSVSVQNFKLQIATDFNIDPHLEYKLKMPADKKAIKKFTSSVAQMVRIFDGEKTYPYMLSHVLRNEEKLLIAKELRYKGFKSLSSILKESGVMLHEKNVTANGN